MLRGSEWSRQRSWKAFSLWNSGSSIQGWIFVFGGTDSRIFQRLSSSLLLLKIASDHDKVECQIISIKLGSSWRLTVLRYRWKWCRFWVWGHSNRNIQRSRLIFSQGCLSTGISQLFRPGHILSSILLCHLRFRGCIWNWEISLLNNLYQNDLIWVLYFLLSLFLCVSQRLFLIWDRGGRERLTIEVLLFQLLHFKLGFQTLLSLQFFENACPFRISFLLNWFQGFMAVDLIFRDEWFIRADLIPCCIDFIVSALKVDAGVSLGGLCGFGDDLGEGDVDHFCLGLNYFDVLGVLGFVEGNFLVCRVGDGIVEITEVDGSFVDGGHWLELNYLFFTSSLYPSP